MCGICGVAGGDPERGRELVGRMCGSMVHRGPDDEGVIQAGGVTLGMRRLSIIDLAGGHQPMHNEDSTVWVVQNGEIYNHLELREELSAAGHLFATQSDTEVLVHGYEQWGEQMVERLNGQFACAVLDQRARQVFLARDRMGIKPLHYAIDGDRFVFASELRALLQDPALRRGVDPIALDEYLAYEFVPSPRSIVRGISKLRPGHTLTWSVAERRPRLRRYWAPQLNIDGSRHKTDLEEECGELRRLLDLVRRLPVRLDGPLGDASIIPPYLLSAFTRQHVKVALGGDGGDELFAGYPTLQAHRLAGYYQRAPGVVRRGLVEPVVRRLPVSRGNLSFDYRAKRFVSGAGYPVAE